MKKAIVTGAAGFIGSHMVELLLNEGYKVIGIDNFINGNKENYKLFAKNENYKFIYLDLSEEFDDSIFKSVDYVFHMAALADIIPSITHPIEYHEANVTATIRVLEAARKHKVKKLVYSASSSCYGIPVKYPTDEDAKIDPQYPYAFTKNIGEQYCLFWNKCYKLPVISLRYFNVYGPRARTNNTYGAVFKVFLKQKLAKKPLTIVGDGEQKRDFIYVTDVVEANLLAAKSSIQMEIINIGTGKPQTINKLAKLIGGKKEYIPKRPGEPDSTHASIWKAKEFLKWKPTVTFEKGVGNMLANINYWKDAPLFTKEKIAKETENWNKVLK